MKRVLILMVSVAFVFSMLGTSVAVPITSSTDAALAGATVMDFESVTLGTYTSLTVEDVTFTAGNSHLMIDDSYGQYNSSGVYLDNGTYNSFGFQSLTIDFATDVNAFGFNWSMSGFVWTLMAYDANDNLIESMPLPIVNASSAGDFYGIASAGISYAVLQGGAFYDWISIDNLNYVIPAGNNAPVPEPATMLLFGLGLLGIAGLGRKKINN